MWCTVGMLLRANYIILDARSGSLKNLVHAKERLSQAQRTMWVRQVELLGSKAKSLILKESISFIKN